METFVVVNIIIYLIVAFALMGFGVFVIGFLIGYKSEDKRIINTKHQNKIIEEKVSEKERKAKKEWKKFLEYDGSTPRGVD